MGQSDQYLNAARNPWLDRLERAAAVVEDHQEALNDARRDRDELIMLAIDEGHLSYSVVARAGGVTKGRISQILAETELTDA